MNHRICVYLLMATLVAVAYAASAVGQEIQFAAQRGPYYVGEPVVVQVVVDRVDAQVDITCQLKGDAPEGLTIEGPRVGQTMRSFTQIVNGKVTRNDSIRYQFGFVATASREGEFQVGPFEIIANGRRQEVAGKLFRFDKLSNDPDMKISVTVPDTTIYVGQEVPVTIQWSFAGDLEAVRYAFSNLQIRSPLFDQFSFEQQPARSRTTLSIATAQGVMDVDAKVTQERVDQRDFIIVTGTLKMIPDTPGDYAEIPITCRTEKVSEWERSFFGGLTPRSRVPALAAGEPISLQVKSIPLSGRPASFSGAVGRGFDIEASANRSVVRVGDPIALNVVIRGEGDLSSLSLPPLDSSPGISEEVFQIPNEQPTGTVDGNQKQFKVTLRVKDASVSQVPPLAFSWFDPYQERFATVTSKPIALQVMQTQVVSSADVIAAPGRQSRIDESDVGMAVGGGPQATGERLDFVGANLAITRDPTRLIAETTSRVATRRLLIGCYLLSGVVVSVSLVLRRRAGRDQQMVGKKKRLRELDAQLSHAGELPAKEAAAEIADVLRNVLSSFEVNERDGLESLVARCDNIRYTTSTVGDGQVTDLAATAKKLVHQVVGQQTQG